MVLNSCGRVKMRGNRLPTDGRMRVRLTHRLPNAHTSSGQVDPRAVIGGVTTMERKLGRTVPSGEVAAVLLGHFGAVFAREIIGA